MQVVRQDRNGIDSERQFPPGARERLPQRINPID
jgi:hypothetical protein